MQIDFLGKRKKTAIISIAAVVLLVGGLGIKGNDALGVDFRGGNLVTLKLEEGSPASDTDKLAEILNGLPFKDESGTDRTIADIQIQAQASATDAGQEYVTIRSEFGSGDVVEEKLKSEFGGEAFDISVEMG